jgi:DNA-binding MarR family transcriptional regulator
VATATIAKRLALSPGTVRYALAKLEGRHLISESAPGSDARQRRHDLTPQGESLVQAFISRSRNLLDDWDVRAEEST